MIRAKSAADWLKVKDASSYNQSEFSIDSCESVCSKIQSNEFNSSTKPPLDFVFQSVDSQLMHSQCNIYSLVDQNSTIQPIVESANKLQKLSPSAWLGDCESIDSTRFTVNNNLHRSNRRRRKPKSKITVITESQLFESQEQEIIRMHNKSDLISLSMTCHGTRIVQALLKDASSRDLHDILVKFHSASNEKIIALCKCKYGNFVMKFFIQNCKWVQIKFIADVVLSHSIVNLACNNIACRIIQELVIRFPNNTKLIVNQLLVEIPKLCMCPYGNHIVRTLLDTGKHLIMNLIIDQIILHIANFATNSYASNILQLILRQANDIQINKILQVIIDTESILSIITNKYGNFVCEQILELSIDQGQKYTQTKNEIIAILLKHNIIIDIGQKRFKLIKSFPANPKSINKITKLNIITKCT
jgi:hypothetical protein